MGYMYACMQWMLCVGIAMYGDMHEIMWNGMEVALNGPFGGAKAKKFRAFPKGRGAVAPSPWNPSPLERCDRCFGWDRVIPGGGTDRVMSHHDRIYITYRSHI